jgi:hypothetical protein
VNAEQNESRSGLSTKALIEAILINPGDTCRDESAMSEEDYILRWCSSLVRKAVDGESIEIAHFTVKEFLKEVLDDISSHSLPTRLTDIPLKSTSRTKAHSKFVKNHPSLQRNTMGRADKSAQVTKAVLVIRSREYTDYSNAVNKFHYSRTAVIRRITGKTKTRQEAHSFWHQCLTNDEEETLISRINTLTD